MLEPQQLADIIESKINSNENENNKVLAGKKVLITAGPTREAIDPVRYITNRSSGKMGYAIAKAAQQLGAEVTIVSGPVTLEAPFGVHRMFVESAVEMRKQTFELVEDADIFIATAAVSDYAADNIATQKIKKNDDPLTLKLKINPDILNDVSQNFPDVFSVGFAAETEHLIKHAKDKMARKKLDMIVANQVGKNKGFDKDTNQLEVIWKEGHISLPEKSKQILAMELMRIVTEQYFQQN
jgi:phosphopantothenoylcysteine decarboxylase/phosphopantothenate--cysteine ligase